MRAVSYFMAGALLAAGCGAQDQLSSDIQDPSRMRSHAERGANAAGDASSDSERGGSGRSGSGGSGSTGGSGGDDAQVAAVTDPDQNTGADGSLAIASRIT
jgi:hypothetical protein